MAGVWESRVSGLRAPGVGGLRESRVSGLRDSARRECRTEGLRDSGTEGLSAAGLRECGVGRNIFAIWMRAPRSVAENPGEGEEAAAPSIIRII
jgi:hypothetical protein